MLLDISDSAEQVTSSRVLSDIAVMSIREPVSTPSISASTISTTYRADGYSYIQYERERERERESPHTLPTGIKWARHIHCVLLSV